MNNTIAVSADPKDNPNTFELVGGPGCGLVVSLPEDHTSDVFEYFYSTSTRTKQFNHSCIYEKGETGDHRAYHKKGT